MNILVAGAAGYIGSVVTEELIKEGNKVIALDNLTQGHRQAVHPKAVFIQMDLANREGLRQVFKDYAIEAVMHLAAETNVTLSMSDPSKYFLKNVVNGLGLLEVMRECGVKKIVFSSTAATYGEPEKTPIRESDATKPVNAYGESKLMFEKILAWYGRAYDLKYVCLRYFNAVGATEKLGEDHRPESHLLPIVLKVAMGQLPYVSIFGTDYDTPDGSCIRDYIHVVDIAQAHILALKGQGSIYNLGSGDGHSILEEVLSIGV